MRGLLKRTNWLTCRITVPQIRALVEECQVYGNRMEAGLDAKRSLKDLYEARKTLMEEISDLELKKEDLMKQIELNKIESNWETCTDHAP